MVRIFTYLTLLLWPTIAPMSAVVTQIAAGVALLASLVGLWWDFDPGARPEQHNNQSATASIATVDRNVSHLDGRATNCPTSTVQGDVGAAVYLKYKADGFKNGKLRVRCSIYDADLHTPLSPAVAAVKSKGADCKQAKANDRPDRVDACGYVVIPTSTTADRAVMPLWVALPASRNNIRVRVAIFTDDDHNTMLAYADSPTFHAGVLSSPQVRAASAEQEKTISHVARRNMSSTARRTTYVAAVAVLRSGSALARGNWAAVDILPYPEYPKTRRHTMLLHRRSGGTWAVIPRSRGCLVPREIVASLGLAALKCPTIPKAK
jgi:hypothetical protein